LGQGIPYVAMNRYRRNRQEPDRGGESTKRRREKIAIGIILVLVAGLTFLEANLAAVGGSVAFTSNLVIFALINLNVILVVLLIFLVTRNLFKLIWERRSGPAWS